MTNAVLQFVKDIAMGMVGIINIVFGIVIFLSPSSQYIKALGISVAIVGMLLILIGSE